jgi:hypothetical protein
MRNKHIVSLLVFVIFTVLVSSGYADVLAGNAILFDGLDDFVRIPDAPQLGGMSGLTVELWFMPYDTSRDCTVLFNKGDGIVIMTDRSYDLALAPHTPSWAVFTGSTGWTWLYGSTPPPITVGQWTHIAATYDSTEGVASLYFNKTLFLTTTTDAARELGCSRRTVTRWCLRLRLGRRLGDRLALTGADIDKLRGRVQPHPGRHENHDEHAGHTHPGNGRRAQPPDPYHIHHRADNPEGIVDYHRPG